LSLPSLSQQDESQLRIAHVTSAVSDAAPGIRAVVEGTIRSLASEPRLSMLLIGVVPRGAAWGSVGAEGVRCIRVDSLPPRSFAYAPGLTSAIDHSLADVIHQHGLWQYSAEAVRSSCAFFGSACVVSPHGMLALQARRHHSMRKSFAWAVYQRKCLIAADALHATSAAELAAIRDVGLRQPVAVVPPGVGVPRARPLKDRKELLTAVCISRLHPLKGIIDLVYAWKRVSPSGWRLIIAGPDEGGHAGSIQATIHQCGLGEQVTLRGGVWAADRDRLLDSSDLFVLPSHSENYGLVVAEALARGVPVLTTTGTPWAVLEREGCGWWVPVGAPGLAGGLEDACRRDRVVLDDMGRRGWNLAQNTFNWSASAAKMAGMYRWLAGRGDLPDCVSW
jgi:glycosyltransferase involved in cell wall biosynthesis